MKTSKLVISSFLAVFLTFGLTVSLQSFLKAWTEPTAAPPGGAVLPLGGKWLENSGNPQEIYYSDGYVGAGTTDPSASLDVSGSIFSTTNIVHAWLSYNDGVRNYGIYQWQDAGTPPVNYFQNSIGVGTTDPQHALDVVGDINASGVICDSNGCIGGGGGSLLQDSCDWIYLCTSGHSCSGTYTAECPVGRYVAGFSMYYYGEHAGWNHRIKCCDVD